MLKLQDKEILTEQEYNTLDESSKLNFWQTNKEDENRTIIYQQEDLSTRAEDLVKEYTEEQVEYRIRDIDPSVIGDEINDLLKHLDYRLKEDFDNYENGLGIYNIDFHLENKDFDNCEDMKNFSEDYDGKYGINSIGICGVENTTLKDGWKDIKNILIEFLEYKRT